MSAKYHNLFWASMLILVAWTVSAHDNVVVVPMTGNAISPAPLAPVADAAPSDSDYIFTAFSPTVIDRATGLEWQRFDDDNTRTWDSAFQYCADLRLSSEVGPSSPVGWRLPSRSELQSIVSYGAVNPAINSTGFPATNASNYWSVSSSALTWNNSWTVNFIDGRTETKLSSNSHYVRCVRNATFDGTALQDNNDGTVTDFATGLMWQKQVDGVARGHANAIGYCTDLVLANQSDWRLPDIKSLSSIVDTRQLAPAIDQNSFPSSLSSLWSSSSTIDDSSRAWVIELAFGETRSESKTSSLYVRCVR